MVGPLAPETLAALPKPPALPKGRSRVGAKAPHCGAKMPHYEIAVGSPVRFVTSNPTSSLVSTARIRLGQTDSGRPFR
jgi:hypothetical protein